MHASDLENVSEARFVAGFLALAFLVAVAQLGLFSSTVSDAWEHLAAAHALSRSPFEPVHPMLGGARPSHLFTPFHLLWGGLARLTGTEPLAWTPVLAAGGMLWVGAGVRTLARHWLGAPGASSLLAILILGLWGRPQDWSGFPQLGMLPETGSYPYWWAFGGALLSLGSVSGPGRRTPGRAVGSVLAVALVFLVHPITGSFLALALGIQALMEDALSVPQRLAWGALPALGLALAFAWPLFPVAEAVFGGESLAFAGGRGFYTRALSGSGPALVGLAFLVPAWRSGPGRLAVAWLAAATALWVVNAFTLGNPAFARYVVFVTLGLQLVVAAGWIRAGTAAGRRRRGLLALLAICLIVQVGYGLRGLGVVRDLQRGTPLGTHSNLNEARRFERWAPLLEEGDVVLAGPADSARLPGLLGVAVVALPHADPFVSIAERDRRNADVALFFAPGSRPEERAELIRRYGVSHVLTDAVEELPAAGIRLRRLDEAGGRILFATGLGGVPR